MTRAGEAYAQRTSAPLTDGSGCSSSPGPADALLPTPEAKLHDAGPDYARRDRPGSGGDDLITAVARALLPTPMTSDTRPGSGADDRRKSPQLRQLAKLLPKPVTTDSSDSARHTTTTGVAHPGTSLTDAIRGDTWDRYTPALTRWADVIGRPAPPAVERGRGGGVRLSPRFPEWMMGLPDGWVTAVPARDVVVDLFGVEDAGTTRAEQLKMLGNGVVPQQAAAALADLLDDVPAHVLADEPAAAADPNG